MPTIQTQIPDLGNRKEGTTILWIDGDSRLTAKMEASARFQKEGASVWVEFEQVFHDFDADISISSPQVDLV